MKTAPSDIVQRQLDAYNARDLEAFLSVFADDAEAGELGAKAPTMVGKDQIRARYGALFANSPDLYSEVVTRTCFEHVVIDLERITGRNGSTECYEVLAIYEISRQLISRVYFVRRP
jgi:uncharacterized protein (TIGR02246 family)